jgi:hypothetical protein
VVSDLAAVWFDFEEPEPGGIRHRSHAYRLAMIAPVDEMLTILHAFATKDPE